MDSGPLHVKDVRELVAELLALLNFGQCLRQGVMEGDQMFNPIDRKEQPAVSLRYVRGWAPCAESFWVALNLKM
jgi:hypothetical protein